MGANGNEEGEKRILRDGLSIIAGCKSRTGDIWEAHFGAAAIASYFFARDNRLDEATARRVRSEAAAMVARYGGNSGGEGAEPRVGDACLPSREAERMVMEALDRSIDGLHWVGHNVIYAAMSLLAIRELGGWGTRADIEGIAELIRAFERTIPGRSWIGHTASDGKKMNVDEDVSLPVIEDASQLSAFVLSELASVRTIYKAEAHHDLLGHMLTFSHALNVLHDLGYRDEFRRGIGPILKLAKALRASRNLGEKEAIALYSPVDRLPLAKAERSERLPTEPEYWVEDFGRHDWDFGHVFKFPFSFYDHLNRLPAGSIPEAVDRFRYLIIDNLSGTGSIK
ncbi:hypothetical protein RB620_05690 [Paenibacillus sp. LHD-117]|uniref:hypothetical protein n=1 Tax=Paenibacillus sp. LHD-117 TaxID=3071412 RepID=UPI0027DF2EBB|nr:hypothetical protein [Paenibacillus sp. LHD-117]MDQ6418929.1 hypothetical protein [Paenibacillus sp. LHD-117]